MERNSKTVQNKTRKKGAGAIGVFVVIAAAILSEMAESDTFTRARWAVRRARFAQALDSGEVFGVIVSILVLALAVFVLATVVKRAKEKNGGKTAGRTSAAVQRHDPRAKSFTKPETYCAVHDHSGEDHFARDRSRRIAQLDEWLKNGLIDRDEYRVLKDRYERDL